MTNSHHTSRILVVNRSLDVLNLFHEILDEQGYEIELSNYTFESLTTIEKLHPDLIILDFGREGSEEEWQLLKMMKLYPPVATIPILICLIPMLITLDVKEYFQQKNIQLLFNPIEKSDLVNKVEQMLTAPAQ